MFPKNTADRVHYNNIINFRQFLSSIESKDLTNQTIFSIIRHAFEYCENTQLVIDILTSLYERNIPLFGVMLDRPWNLISFIYVYTPKFSREFFITWLEKQDMQKMIGATKAHIEALKPIDENKLFNEYSLDILDEAGYPPLLYYIKFNHSNIHLKDPVVMSNPVLFRKIPTGHVAGTTVFHLLIRDLAFSPAAKIVALQKPVLDLDFIFPGSPPGAPSLANILARNGKYELLRQLLEYNQYQVDYNKIVEPNQKLDKVKEKMSLISCLIRDSQTELLKVILEHSEVPVKLSHHDSVQLLAPANRQINSLITSHNDMIQLRINFIKRNINELSIAAKKGDIDKIKEILATSSVTFKHSETPLVDFNLMYWVISCPDPIARKAMLELIIEYRMFTEIDDKLTLLHILGALGETSDEIMKSEQADMLGLLPRDYAAYSGYTISKNKALVDKYDFKRTFETGVLRGASLVWLMAKQDAKHVYLSIEDYIEVGSLDIFQYPWQMMESLIALLPKELGSQFIIGANINRIVYRVATNLEHVYMPFSHFIALYYPNKFRELGQDQLKLIDLNAVYRFEANEINSSKKTTLHCLIEEKLYDVVEKLLKEQPHILVDLESQNEAGITLGAILEKVHPELLQQIQLQNSSVKKRVFQNLISAIESNNINQVEGLLSGRVIRAVTINDIKKFEISKMPINTACFLGRLEILKRLLSHDYILKLTHTIQPNVLIDLIKCEDVEAKNQIISYLINENAFELIDTSLTDEHILAAQGTCELKTIMQDVAKETRTYPPTIYLILAIMSEDQEAITEMALHKIKWVVEESKKHNISVMTALLLTGNTDLYAHLITYISDIHANSFNLSDTYIDLISATHLQKIESPYYGISVAHKLALSGQDNCLRNMLHRCRYKVNLEDVISFGEYTGATLSLTLCINDQYDLLEKILIQDPDLTCDLTVRCEKVSLHQMLAVHRPGILDLINTRNEVKRKREEAEALERQAKKREQKQTALKEERARNSRLFLEAQQEKSKKEAQIEREPTYKEAIVKLFADYNIIAEFDETSIKNKVLLFIHVTTKDANLIAPYLKDKTPKMERNPQSQASRRKAKHELLFFNGNETQFTSLFNSKTKGQIDDKLKAMHGKATNPEAESTDVVKKEDNSQSLVTASETVTKANVNAKEPGKKTQKVMTQEQLGLWEDYIKSIFCKVQEMEIHWHNDKNYFEVKLPIGIRWTFPNINKGVVITLSEDFIQRDLLPRVKTKLQTDTKTAKVDIDTSIRAARTIYITPLEFNIIYDKMLIDAIKLKIEDFIPKSRSEKSNPPVIKPKNEDGSKNENDVKYGKMEADEEEVKEDSMPIMTNETANTNDDAGLAVSTLCNLFLSLQRSAGLGETQFKNILSNCTFKEGTHKLRLELKTTAAPIGHNLYIKPQDFFAAIQLYCDVIQKQFMKTVITADKHLFIFDLDLIPLVELNELIAYFRQDIVDKLKEKTIKPVPTVVSSASYQKVAKEEELPVEAASQSIAILPKLKIAFSRMTEKQNKNLCYHVEALEQIKKDNIPNDIIHELAYIGNILQILLTIAQTFDVPGRPSGNNIFYQLRNVIRHAYEKMDFNDFYQKTLPLIDLVVFHLQAAEIAKGGMVLKNQSLQEHLNSLMKLEQLVSNFIEEMQKENLVDMKLKTERIEHYQQRLDKVDANTVQHKSLYRDAVLTLSMFKGEYQDYSYIHKIIFIILGHHKLRKGSRVDFDYESNAGELFERIQRLKVPRKALN